MRTDFYLALKHTRLSEEVLTITQSHEETWQMMSSGDPSEEKLPNKALTAQKYAELLTFAQLECDKLSWDDYTRLLNRAVVVTALSQRWPEVQRQKLEEIATK
jgi:endonuclease YncB( thermonuclease family)